MAEIEPLLPKNLLSGPGWSALRRESSLSEVFHENTKLGPLTGRAYAAWLHAFSRSERARQTLEHPYKVYSLMERVEVPRVEARTELERTLEARRSRRRFTAELLTPQELGRLLAFSYGRTGPEGRFRPVASGGALYPLELYAAVFRVAGIEPGIYHWGVEAACLDVVRRGELLPRFGEVLACQGIELDRSALVLVVTALFRRTTAKYRDRGYRLILLEAGEVAQNLALLAASMGLGACLVGGFDDDGLARLLEVDGLEEAPLVAMVVGRPADPVAAGAGRADGQEAD